MLKQERKALLHRAEDLQLAGDIAGAADVYRSIPELSRILTTPGLRGLPVQGPHFVIIGAARAGTTWLKQALGHHPDIFIKNGEPHYFSLQANRRTLRWYVEELFADGSFKRKTVSDWSNENKIYGEKSPTYLTMPDANIDLMAAAFPKLKIICNVRDPAAREASHFRKLGLDPNTEDRNEILAVVEVKKASWYDYHLTRFAKRFTRKRILKVDFERIKSEPGAIYSDVLRHIGARPFELPDEARDW